MQNIKILLILVLAPVLIFTGLKAQSKNDSLTLDQCINYALSNKPAVKQAQIDEAIGEREINANLSGWLPQVSSQYNLQHYLKLPTSILPDFSDLSSGRRVAVKTGVANVSNILLQANQTLYNNEILLASRAANFTRKGLDQNTKETKINTVVEVSKSFYDILLTQEQLRILNENIKRQEKQYIDALSRYEAGLVDKTDYQRAGITLANIRSDRKRTQESIKAKNTYLKQLIGFPAENELLLAFEKTMLEEQVKIDTMQLADYNNRIEFQQLQTRKMLLGINTSYYQWGFLPTVSGFINYNWVYQNNEFSELYKKTYPTSVAGLSMTLPIFQGTKRIQNLKKAQLQEDRLEIDIENTKNIINTEYQTALSNYKSDYNEWQTLQQNAKVAEEVYNIINLQYTEGIKTYLDLIIAETELRTAQINYYNALYRVLASKLDYQKALGNIEVK